MFIQLLLSWIFRNFRWHFLTWSHGVKVAERCFFQHFLRLFQQFLRFSRHVLIIPMSQSKGRGISRMPVEKLRKVTGSSKMLASGSPLDSPACCRVWALSALNWTQVLRGEWMLHFYAPWCPACQQIESAWESFARNSEQLNIAVGKVDVTQEPGLSGRFFVTTLPTIYHAKDGVFRRFRGSRTLEDLQDYIIERKWEGVEPVAGWHSPSSIMMHGMAGLFHLSGWIRQVHSYFTSTLGIHVWGSYAIFILATLLIGLILGLILVLLGECFCPPKSRYKAETSEVIEKENAELSAVEESPEAEELSAEELEAAAEEKDLSDGEDGAQSSDDASEEDSTAEQSGTEDATEQYPTDSESQISVRQRKSQMADNGL